MYRMLKDVVAVTNRKLCTRPFLEQIERVCLEHPRAVIIREKDLTEEEYALLAGQVYKVCQKYQVPCIYHTFAKAAIEAGVTAIHLPLGELKRLYGSDVLDKFENIGTSVHSLEEAKMAQRMGASYLTAGHIYATDCKKGVPPRGTEFLREICREVKIPVYAIGGIQIDREQIKEVKDCGAEGACIMSGMMRI